MLKAINQIQGSVPLTPMRKLAGQSDISVTCASCHSMAILGLTLCYITHGGNPSFRDSVSYSSTMGQF